MKQLFSSKSSRIFRLNFLSHNRNLAGLILSHCCYLNQEKSYKTVVVLYWHMLCVPYFVNAPRFEPGFPPQDQLTSRRLSFQESSVLNPSGAYFMAGEELVE
jgi:hypothetical protein